MARYEQVHVCLPLNQSKRFFGLKLDTISKLRCHHSLTRLSCYWRGHSHANVHLQFYTAVQIKDHLWHCECTESNSQHREDNGSKKIFACHFYKSKGHVSSTLDYVVGIIHQRFVHHFHYRKVFQFFFLAWAKKKSKVTTLWTCLYFVSFPTVGSADFD